MESIGFVFSVMSYNRFSQEQKMIILKRAAKIGVRQAADKKNKPGKSVLSAPRYHIATNTRSIIQQP